MQLKLFALQLIREKCNIRRLARKLSREGLESAEWSVVRCWLGLQLGEVFPETTCCSVCCIASRVLTTALLRPGNRSYSIKCR